MAVLDGYLSMAPPEGPHVTPQAAPGRLPGITEGHSE